MELGNDVRLIRHIHPQAPSLRSTLFYAQWQIRVQLVHHPYLSDLLYPMSTVHECCQNVKHSFHRAIVFLHRHPLQPPLVYSLFKARFTCHLEWSRFNSSGLLSCYMLVREIIRQCRTGFRLDKNVCDPSVRTLRCVSSSPVNIHQVIHRLDSFGTSRCSVCRHIKVHISHIPETFPARWYFDDWRNTPMLTKTKNAPANPSPMLPIPIGNSTSLYLAYLLPPSYVSDLLARTNRRASSSVHLVYL